MSPEEWADAARILWRRQTLYHGPPRRGDGGSGEALERALDTFPAEALVAAIREGVEVRWHRGSLILDVDGQRHEAQLEPEDSYREGFRVLNPPTPAALRIVCLCMYGLAAGFMERFGVERALQRLGVEAAIDVVEKAEWRAKAEDAAVIVGQEANEWHIREQLGTWDGPLVVLHNLLDEDEITDKLGAALRSVSIATPGAPEPELPPEPEVDRVLRWVRSLPAEVWIGP